VVHDWYTHSDYEVRWVYEEEVTIGIKVDDKVIELNLKPGDKLEVSPILCIMLKLKQGLNMSVDLNNLFNKFKLLKIIKN
jgi:cupin superfamily acireductone dioxygenase involved in methionine salvage